eukprot:CCRYP_005100-RA/>CCRYP_005100-RA protein AED:0.47 eAED:0.46 QI:0/0/0/0.5/0/0/2/0/280
MAMSTMPRATIRATDVKRTHTKHRCDGEGRKQIVNNINQTSYNTLTYHPIPTHSTCHTVSNQYATSLYEHKTLTATNNSNYAIVNFGASNHYLTPTANIKAKTTLHHPIQVTLPNQSTLWSSHVCELDIPLPKTAKQGYILPGMKNHSLILDTKMCDAGCKVIFSQDECSIVHNGTIVMKGHKNKQKGIWYIPIQQSIHETLFLIYNDHDTQSAHTGNSVYHTSTLAKTIKYIHQCLFSPTVDSFYKAIINDQLIGFPQITSAQVRKYLPKSTATAKGHL